MSQTFEHLVISNECIKTIQTYQTKILTQKTQLTQQNRNKYKLGQQFSTLQQFLHKNYDITFTKNEMSNFFLFFAGEVDPCACCGQYGPFRFTVELTEL